MFSGFAVAPCSNSNLTCLDTTVWSVDRAYRWEELSEENLALSGWIWQHKQVCVRERQKKTERQREKERETARVCMIFLSMLRYTMCLDKESLIGTVPVLAPLHNQLPGAVSLHGMYGIRAC